MGLKYADLIQGDKFEFIGRFRIDEYIIEKDKYIKGKWQKNLITDKFKELIAETICGLGEEEKITIKYLAVGTNDTTPVSSNTALNSQLGTLKEHLTEALNNYENSQVASGLWYYDSPEAQYYGTLVELGLYGSDGLTLLTHSLVYPSVTFNSEKTLNILYEVGAI